MPFPDRPSSGSCVPESSFRMGCIFRQRPGAESTSQNPVNSVVRWLSERRANDAKRKTHIENGVISRDDVARWCCRGGWPANLGLSDEHARETASRYVCSKARVRVRPKRYFCDPSLAPAFLAVVVGRGGHRLHTRRRRGSDPHGGTWGVVVLRGAEAS